MLIDSGGVPFWEDNCKLTIYPDDNLEIFYRKIPHFHGVSTLSIREREHLNHLNSDVFTLTSIKTLDLKGNSFSAIPPEIKRLKDLSILSFSEQNTKVVSIPNDINELEALKSLYLNNNDLGEIPTSILSIPNLEYLELSNNKIKYIPKDIRNLSSLKELDLSTNCIELLSEELLELESLIEINIMNNPIILEDTTNINILNSLKNKGVEVKLNNASSNFCF